MNGFQGQTTSYLIYQSRLQHIYRGQPYARVDYIPQSGTLDLASAVHDDRLRIKKIFVF